MVGALQSTADSSEFEGKRVLARGGTNEIGQAIATRSRFRKPQNGSGLMVHGNFFKGRMRRNRFIQCVD